MSDCMTFPDTVEEFMEQYKVVDTDCVYSNGIEFVPIFRMKQWFEHLQDAQEVQPDRMKLVQQAVNTIMSTSRSYSIRDRAFRNAARLVQCAIDGEAPDFEQIPEGDEMPSEQKWIPCSERLPENREWVLGIFQEWDTGWINPIPFICDYVGKKTPITTQDNWLLKMVDEPHPYYEKLRCIAWMPLPEPARLEGE